jgi:CheY-like chemotaxis protein
MNASEKGLAGLRVLVVEDETMVSLLIQDMLDDLGCVVAEQASTLAEALEKAQTLAFDVAVLDVNLGGERSFPVAEWLGERGRPYIFVTGYATSSLPQAFADKTLLQKPFLQADLGRALLAVM